MSERSGSAAGFFRLFRRPPPDPHTAIDQTRARELAESMAILRERQKRERSQFRMNRIVKLWPVGVGLALGVLSPVLQAVAELFGPWCRTLVFPFVVLAQRPEIQVGPITHLLPTFMLYAQFPIEGLLARIILKRRIHPLGVAGQVALFHFLGILELWMLSGVGQRLLGR